MKYVEERVRGYVRSSMLSLMLISCAGTAPTEAGSLVKSHLSSLDSVAVVVSDRAGMVFNPIEGIDLDSLSESLNTLGTKALEACDLNTSDNSEAKVYLTVRRQELPNQQTYSLVTLEVKLIETAHLHRHSQEHDQNTNTRVITWYEFDSLVLLDSEAQMKIEEEANNIFRHLAADIAQARLHAGIPMTETFKERCLEGE